MTIYLDADRYADPKALHAGLKLLLDLPAYYGGNADALHDCIAERVEKPTVWVASRGEGATAEALERCLAALKDAGADVRA